MAGGAHGSYRAALRLRDFRLLTAAFLVDELGGWAASVVMVVWVFDRTGSTGWIVAMTAAGWVPRLLVPTWAGVLADRYERTLVMIVSALSTFLVVTVLALVVATDGPVLLALALTAAAACTSSLNRPAASAVLPDAVPEQQLTAANALHGALENAVVIGGPALGGLLLVTGGPASAIVFNALSFLVAAILLSQVRTRSRGGAGTDGEGLLAQVGTGLAALREQPVALLLVLFCALDSAVYGASTVLYVPLSLDLGTGTEGYSYLIAAMAVGGVVAAGLASRLSVSARLTPVIVGGMLVLALPFATLTLVDSPVLAAALLVVSGGGMVVVDVLAITALQRDLPREVLSRVFGVFDAVVILGIFLASVATSAVLSLTDLDTALLVVGLGVPLLTLLGLRPMLRVDAQGRARVEALRPKVQLLEALELFAGAGTPVLSGLAAQLEDVRLARGEVLLRQGDPADAVYVLVDGELAVTARTGTGRPRSLRTVGPRSYVGEIGVLRGVPRTATVRATEDCLLWRLSGEAFLQVLENAPVSASMMRTIGSRVARSADRGAHLPPEVVDLVPRQRDDAPDLTAV